MTWSAEDHARARALCDAATPGEWTATFGEAVLIKDQDGNSIATINWLTKTGRRPGDEGESNAKLIAAARTLLPAALAEIERLQKRCADLEAALDEIHSQAFAAINPANWQTNNGPEARLEHYERTLNDIANREYHWTAETLLETCQKVAADFHAAEIERLKADNERLKTQVKRMRQRP
jgi:hypothetical protein